MRTVKLDGFCECVECGQRIYKGYVFAGGDIDVYGCKECAKKSYEMEEKDERI